MPRQIRLEYEEALYHVMARGNRGDLIYRDENDRQVFLDHLEKACQKTGWRVHAYCLMGNHYHLLLETPRPNLSDGMKWLQSTYTQRFHQRYRTYGHLFQGRYKALVIDDRSPGYFAAVANYVHRNPLSLIEPGQSLQDYPWSSLYFFGKRSGAKPSFFEWERVLRENDFGETLSERNRYGRWLETERIDSVEMEKKLERGWYYGGSEFKEQVLERFGEKVRGKELRNYAGEQSRDHGVKMAETILKIGLREFELEREDLSSLKKGDERKVMIASLIKRYTTVRLRWIAEQLVMGDKSRVSNSVGQWEKSQRSKSYQKIEKKILQNAKII